MRTALLKVSPFTHKHLLSTCCMPAVFQVLGLQQ